MTSTYSIGRRLDNLEQRHRKVTTPGLAEQLAAYRIEQDAIQSRRRDMSPKERDTAVMGDLEAAIAKTAARLEELGKSKVLKHQKHADFLSRVLRADMEHLAELKAKLEIHARH